MAYEDVMIRVCSSVYYTRYLFELLSKKLGCTQVGNLHSLADLGWPSYLQAKIPLRHYLEVAMSNARPIASSQNMSQHRCMYLQMQISRLVFPVFKRYMSNMLAYRLT